MLKFFILCIVTFLFISCGTSKQFSKLENNVTNPKISQQLYIAKERNYYLPKAMTSFSIILSEETPDSFDAAHKLHFTAILKNRNLNYTETKCPR